MLAVILDAESATPLSDGIEIPELRANTCRFKLPEICANTGFRPRTNRKAESYAAGMFAVGIEAISPISDSNSVTTSGLTVYKRSRRQLIQC